MKNYARFTPGKQNGEPVNVKMTIPISFRIPPDSENIVKTGVAVHPQPKLIGGFTKLLNNVQYPISCKEAGVEGRVVVQFIINKQGIPVNIRVVRGIGHGCNREAVKVIREYARFIPGKLNNGTPINTKMSLPIVFKLPNSPKRH